LKSGVVNLIANGFLFVKDKITSERDICERALGLSVRDRTQGKHRSINQSSNA